MKKPKEWNYDADLFREQNDYRTFYSVDDAPHKVTSGSVIHVVVVVIVVCTLQMTDNLEIGKSPCMPRFIPCWVMLCSQVVRLKDFVDV